MQGATKVLLLNPIALHVSYMTFVQIASAIVLCRIVKTSRDVEQVEYLR